MATFTTACPRNCYSTCSLRVEVEDGRLRSIEAHPDNRATVEGPCLKGLSYVERQVSPDRILHPLRRLHDGRFARVGWDEALDEIADRLERLRRSDGPQSLLYYSASGTKGLLNGVGLDFWKKWGGCTTTYGDLCWPAGLEATRLTLGENKHNAPWDLANARLIVMWGKNQAETNIHQGIFVDQALRAGAKLVVIDPRRTETAERADLLLQPRPGTDGALALALAGELLRRDAVDHDFLDAHVSGLEDFAASAGAWTLERAAEVCDLDVGDVGRLADWMAEVSPMTINAGFGMQRYTNSGQTMRAMIALCVLTGNLGKPGAGWIFADLQSMIFDEVKDPVAFYPPEDASGPVRVAISTTRLGVEMQEISDPPLRMMWVERGNPVTQNPNTAEVLRAMRGLDFRVVVEQFLTDTAREADLVLPAKTLFEQSDVIGAYWHPYVQLKQKILEPPGEVRPESEIYWHLAERLGIDPGEEIPAPGDEAVEAFLERRLEPFEGLDLEALRKGPLLAPGHQEIAFADHVFPTPSGKIELRSGEAVERWGVDAVATHAAPTVQADEPGHGDRLWLMTPNTKNRIHSQFNNLRMIRAYSPRPLLHVHPADARRRGLHDDDRARVSNERGHFVVAVRLDPSLREGCVSITNGWWISEGGGSNFCSPSLETDMGHGAAFHDDVVIVERLS